MNVVTNRGIEKMKKINMIKSMVAFLGLGMSVKHVIPDTVSLGKVVRVDGGDIRPAGNTLEILTKIKAIGLLGITIPDGCMVTYNAEPGTGSDVCILNNSSEIIAWTTSTGHGGHMGELVISDDVSFLTDSRTLSMGVYPTVRIDEVLDWEIDSLEWVRSNGKLAPEEYRVILRETTSIHHIMPLVEDGDVITISLSNGDVIELTKEGNEVIAGYVRYTSIPSDRGFVKELEEDGFVLVASTILVDGMYSVSMEYVAK